MGQLPLVLKELLRYAKAVWGQPQLQWSPSRPTQAELDAAKQEAMGANQFDRLGLKRGVWQATHRGGARTVCMELGAAGAGAGAGAPLARVVAFLPKGVQEPDWDLWARVFQWFGRAASGQPWLVTWFAAETPRRFPGVGQDLGPEHVNGGYTQPCSTAGIFIYRAEEATRVLVHELLHAACLDEQGWSIPEREAQIEVWAELILIALRAKGAGQTAASLWVKQSHWVVDVNWKAATFHGTHDISDYAWRYLSGREGMYQRLGIALPAARPEVARGMSSLRFTHPALGV